MYLGANPQIGSSVSLALPMANRHGLVAGATGTGKTVTLQTLAEGFSQAGVPVFLADVKGDLSGMALPGQAHAKISQRVEQLGLKDYRQRPFPVVFWDLFNRQGHPIRATVSDMGPALLANLLQLNDTQSGILQVIFKIADDEGLLLLDSKDLRALLSWVIENSKELKSEYGSLSSSSVAAIQRKLLALEQQGAEQFFGEPQVELRDLMQTDFSGNGVISILDATDLMQQPKLYAMFLLWLIAEMFEQLPEAGDTDKPKLVFFFDEAHLLFEDAPKELSDKIEQVVRLIRSKGVGIYFVTQSPLDIPENILGQLGNRVQHALRAFTPKDQKAVRAAAQTFRTNPKLNTETAITELGVGEALVSVLDPKGTPTPVERILICPPQSQIGPLTAEQRQQQLQKSPFKGRYDAVIDRESAYERLKQRAESTHPERQATATRPRGRPRQSVFEAMAKSAARAIGSSLGRQLVRGLLGSLLK
ncbi:MAG: DUF853 domain-containing protein [Gammaproteobacteria bacterium]|nr:DUF853 domain-containing protein [Gammaproteobacteria bacterium]MDH5799437.1 DUF853 domain-containing protein [Gammaproteobacteria bacterium]